MRKDARGDTGAKIKEIVRAAWKRDPAERGASLDRAKVCFRGGVVSKERLSAILNSLPVEFSEVRGPLPKTGHQRPTWPLSLGVP